MSKNKNKLALYFIGLPKIRWEFLLTKRRLLRFKLFANEEKMIKVLIIAADKTYRGIF
ncbi:hypothetical protein [Serratia inhibens]|uniref:hypothetical protein n=1 Tax=Serratia inhibens TaxID=2338073 RepID=UPI001313FFF8|nr:hypothetical protein [Serratia inhibens]